MKKNTALLKGILMVILFFAFGIQQSNADTYTVTSTSLIGPGSFLAAVDSANNNPGPDIIEFTDNLQVNDNFSGVFGNKNTWMVEVTESLVIDGKGGALNGRQDWVNTDGRRSLVHCPDPHQYNDLIMAYMQNWLYIGEFNKDNSDIEVTVKNLTIKQFNSVASVNQNASLTFENFKAYDTWNTWGCIALGAIGVQEGGSLTIRDSEFYRLETWEDPQHYATAIIGIDAGDLIIEGSLFSELSHRDQFAIYWIGEAGSKVNIVSSRFRESGGIRIDGEVSETNIVNSIWVTAASAYHPKFGDRIVNKASGDMNIIASSLRWNTNECQYLPDGSTCEAYNIHNLIESGGSGKINFIQSAVGFTIPSAPTAPGYFNTLGALGAGGFTADQYTWIEPTVVQDAAALKAITNQPDLRTVLPGFAFFYPFTSVVDYDPAMVTPASPGQLIDIIPFAGDGGANALINPIDGSFIEFDAIGHPRVDDATGQRDIGALQVGGGGPPILSLVGTGDGSVDLSWSVPVNPDGLGIIEYVILYYPTSSPSSTATFIAYPPVTSATVGSLTNGTEYTFEIKAIWTDGTQTAYSNNVTATPYGVLGTPDVTAVAGNKEVALSWTLPDLGERTFESFTILWRIAGTTDYTDALAIYNPGKLDTTITGLKNGTTYEFAVGVLASGDFSEKGLATATPFNPAPPVGDDCTLSHGYWKKHSEYGPASYNATWAELADGANTPFFLSGQTYYEVINSPTANNAYYILAHQYIAAELNILQGADATDAQAAFDAATILFNTYVPSDIAGLPGSDPLRGQFIDHADILEMYNTGDIGPGYCEEYKSAPIVPDESLKEMISYYPNPVNDILHIETDRDFRISILSITGQLLVDVQNEKAIDVSQLNNGLYIIRIEIEGRFYTDKISKH